MRTRAALLAMSIVLGLGLCATQAHATSLLLDWDDNPWIVGSLTGSYALGTGSVDIDITGNFAALQAGSPSTDSVLDPYLDGQNSLRLDGTGNSSDPLITTTFSFNYVGGVTNIQFSILDIDYSPFFGRAGFQDVIEVQGRRTDGTWVGATSVLTNPDPVEGVSYEINTLADSTQLRGISAAENTGSTAGVATIAFNDGFAYDQFRIIYSNRQPVSTTQYIAFSDISFETVPEPGPALLMGLVLLGISLARKASRRTDSV